MLINLKESDYYVVYNDYFMEDFSRELNLLYLPLIGSDAVKLYSFFFTKILNDNNMTNNLLHYDILDNMVFDLKKFNFVRKKLEALGLLKSYITESENNIFYIYKIEKPLSFCQFFNNSLLSTILENTIGDVLFTQLKEKFGGNKLKFSAYSDISAKFSDLYSDYTVSNIENIKDDAIGPNLSEYFFDFTKLNFHLTNLYIEDILEDKFLKQNILELAHLYKASPEEMASALENSLEVETGGTTVSINKLKDYLMQLFINVKKQNVPTLDNMLNKHFVQSTYSNSELTEKELFAQKIDNISYIDFLNKKYGIILSNVDASNIFKIQEKYNFPSGVLTILLDFAIQNSNTGGVPNFNYIDKIASSWSSQKFVKAIDAINYVNEQSSNRKKSSKSNINYNNLPKNSSKNTTRKVNKTPDYIKEQLESVGESSVKQRVVTKVDEEQHEKLKKLLEEKGIS